MDYLFFDAADKALFVRNDAESAQWTVDEMSLVLVFPYDAGKVLHRGQRVGFVDFDGVFQAFEVRKAESLEPDHYQRITAEHIAISELTDEHCPGAAYTDITAQEALSAQLVGTLWSVGNVTASGTSSADIGMGSKWQAVRTIESNWNVYITPRITYDASGITGRYLDIVPAVSTWRGLRLALDKNADEVGVTYDDTDCLTAMYGYGRSVAEAAHTVNPATFSLVSQDHVMVASGSSITVNAAEGWDIYRYMLPQRMTVKIDEILRNNGVENVVVAAYIYENAYYPMSAGDTSVIADGFAINCRRTTTSTAGTQQSLAPASFSALWYTGHAFKDVGGVPTVAPMEDWDLMCLNLDAPTVLRLDSLTANGNASGVYPMFYERGGTYYPLSAGDAGSTFEAARLLINRKRTVTTETGTQQTITPPTGFTLLQQGKAFMGDADGNPAFVTASDWDVYRIALTAGQTIRLDELTVNGVTSIAYPAGYEQGGVYIPLSIGDVGTEFQADALIINCLRTTETTGGTWTALSLAPANFTAVAYQGGALMQNGANAYVQMASNWDIVEYAFGSRTRFKVTGITKNPDIDGVVVAGYVVDGVFVALPLDDTTTEFQADGIVINYYRDVSEHSATAVNISYYAGGSSQTVNNYSITGAKITPNVRHVTSYTYSLTSAAVTPLTVVTTRDYSANSITYMRDDGAANGTASLTFGSVAWSTEDGDPANKPGGQEYVEDTAATAAFGRNGRPRFGYYQNGNVSDPELLLALTWQALQQSKAPRVSIDMMVRDLYRLGYADQTIRLHDMALVEIEPIGVTLGLEIIRLQVDLIDPTATRPTIGAYIPNIVYINRETAARASGGGGRGVGNGRGQTAAQKELSEFETEIAANNYQISLRAYQRDMDNVDEILRQAGLSIDASGVLVYADDNPNNWQSRLQVQADRIGLVVQGTGENAHIKAASIMAAINADGSSISINADKIKLNGNVSIAGILTGQTQAYALRANLLRADNSFMFKGRYAAWVPITFMTPTGMSTRIFLVQE